MATEQAVPGTVVNAGSLVTPGGEQGVPGATGAVWWNGAGPPGTISGSKPGDYYLDTTTGNIYVL